MFPDKAAGGKYAWIDARLVADMRRPPPGGAVGRADAGKSCGKAYMPLDTGRIARRMQMRRRPQTIKPGTCPGLIVHFTSAA